MIRHGDTAVVAGQLVELGHSWWCSLCWTWHRQVCTHPLVKPR